MNPILLAADAEPSVLAVPIHEVVIGLIAFFVVFALLSKFALPGIRKALEERTAAIEGGIAKAEAAQVEANATRDEYLQKLAEARTEAAAIRAQAQADKTAILEEARSEAAEVAAAIATRAEASIAAERASVITSLRREVGDLAMTLAGKVVGENLSDDARAQATVDRFLADLESQADAAEAAH